VRPVLIVDGTHLSGKYKGVLLTASGQDANFQNKGLAKMVCAAAFSYRRKDFNDHFGKLRQANGACVKYLEDIGNAKWTRTYFPGNRYNLLTSNVAEQLNNALRKARPSPIIELFMFIQRMLTRWF
ncbi:unnamed protein product, partial [Brassica oleracea]